MSALACEICGASIAHKGGRGRPRRFCKSCRPPAPPRAPIKCPTCGHPFMRSCSSQRYCSKLCRLSDRFGGPRYCEVCGDRYLPTKPTQRACGYKCGIIVSGRKPRPNFCAVPWRQCASGDCGEWLIARGRRRFCSGCAEIGIPSFSPSRKVRNAIYERDGWVCQLCDRPVDPGAAVASPESASIDHIVPRSLWPRNKKGVHSIANLQLAHLICNIHRQALSVEAARTVLARENGSPGGFWSKRYQPENIVFGFSNPT